MTGREGGEGNASGCIQYCIDTYNDIPGRRSTAYIPPDGQIVTAVEVGGGRGWVCAGKPYRLLRFFSEVFLFNVGVACIPFESSRNTGIVMVKMKEVMTRLAHRPRLIGRLD